MFFFKMHDGAPRKSTRSPKRPGLNIWQKCLWVGLAQHQTEFIVLLDGKPVRVHILVATLATPTG